MDFGVATYGLALLAGALSTLSPCVLPLVPVLVAAAVSVHRWGAVALGVGLALSFTVVGLFVATLGASLGLDPDTFRTVGAVILVLFGFILLIPWLQNYFSRAASVLTNSGNTLLSRITGSGLNGQFLVGAVLGIVWSPCVGPTLGLHTRQPGAKCYANRFFDAHVWRRRGSTVNTPWIAVASPHGCNAWRSVERRPLWEAGVRPCDGDLRRPDRCGPR
jgi:flagellar biosynthesis protein FliQ